MKKTEKLIAQVEDAEIISQAIMDGINRGASVDKPYDKALFIKLELLKKGFKIYRKK